MPRAHLGLLLRTATKQPPPLTAAVALGARARGRLSVSTVPAPGAFIVVAAPSQFSGDPPDTWRPAAEGGWGTVHLGAPSAWGTVLSAERSKEAAVKEEEDIHGILYKAGLGDTRHRLEVRCVMRFAATVETSDDVIIGGATWHIARVQEIWSAGEWGELALSLVRWPTLTRRAAFAAAAL